MKEKLNYLLEHKYINLSELSRISHISRATLDYYLNTDRDLKYAEHKRLNLVIDTLIDLIERMK